MPHLNWLPRWHRPHHLSRIEVRIRFPLVDRTYHLLCLRVRPALPLGRPEYIFDTAHRLEGEGSERFDRAYLAP
jgi:hypothetical protein